MIQAYELRIDNLVFIKGHQDNIFKILDIGSALSTVNGGQVFKVAYDEMEPIPITEGRLLSFGFNKCDQNGLQSFYNKGSVCIGLQEGAADFGFIEDGIFNNFVDVYYIHDLQNLYRAVTKTELEMG